MSSLQQRFSEFTEGEKERFILVAKYSKIVDTDWEAAAKEYGKSTPASLKTVFNKSYKKLQAGLGSGTAEATSTGAAGGGGKNSSVKKRKGFETEDTTSKVGKKLKKSKKERFNKEDKLIKDENEDEGEDFMA